jgi:hypothetical protein
VFGKAWVTAQLTQFCCVPNGVQGSYLKSHPRAFMQIEPYDVRAVLQTLADCRLGQQHLGGNASACSFDAKDLSWVNIRLGN